MSTIGENILQRDLIKLKRFIPTEFVVVTTSSIYLSGELKKETLTTKHYLKINPKDWEHVQKVILCAFNMQKIFWKELS
jgi:hypothetical protein